MIYVKPVIFASKLAGAGALVFAFSQQDLTNWGVAVAGSLLLFVPIYRRASDEWLKTREKAVALRRKDCEEELKRERALHAELRKRIADLERDIDAWERRFDAWGSRDHPKMG